MVNKLIRDAAKRLTLSDTPLLDARVLLAKAANKSDASLIFDMPDEKQLALFYEYIKKRESGIPVAYIIGEKDFMDCTFLLNSHTLIPRPDTECLVERVLEENKKDNPTVIDLCTGSGCVGICLAKALENSFVSLTDISLEALSTAEENAKRNGVQIRTKVFLLDILKDEFPAGYDIITANPPYIETQLAKKLPVSRYEPFIALDGGDDGLKFYRIIAEKAFAALPAGGLLALEIGYNQKESVLSLLERFSRVCAFKDYGGNDRVIIAIK